LARAIDFFGDGEIPSGVPFGLEEGNLMSWARPGICRDELRRVRDRRSQFWGSVPWNDEVAVLSVWTARWTPADEGGAGRTAVIASIALWAWFAPMAVGVAPSADVAAGRGRDWAEVVAVLGGESGGADGCGGGGCGGGTGCRGVGTFRRREIRAAVGTRP